MLPDFRKDLETAGPCAGCGTVRSIRELTKSRPNPTTSSTRSPYRDEVLVGAVFYQPLSKDASSYVGGVGTPEMRARIEMTSYQLTILMDDGTYRFAEQRDGTRFRTGDRVRIAQGRVELL